MTRSTLKYFIIFALNILVLLESTRVDVEQLMDDLSFISVVNVYDKNLMILSISLLVTLLTSMFCFFKPFKKCI